MRLKSFGTSTVKAFAVLFCLSGAALADDSAKVGIGHGPADQKSLPSNAPAATTTGTTGATDQGKTVKTMNQQEKSKIETGGK